MTGNALVAACPACAEPAAHGDVFCEACGARITPERGPAAAATDRGLVHLRNEDAYALLVEPTDTPAVAGPAIVVVCDGVSSSVTPERAARVAADTAADCLAASLRDGDVDIPAAIAAAQDAVRRIPWSPRGALAAPSCTLVAATWDDATITLGSVGDSRAYWIGADRTATLLTRDDSWAQHQVDHGVMSASDAARHPNAHAITHWIGADAPDDAPVVTQYRPLGPGHLLVCTDGLWNYAPEADDMAAIVHAVLPAPPADLARALVAYALERGGHDNVTVALLALDPDPEESA